MRNVARYAAVCLASAGFVLGTTLSAQAATTPATDATILPLPIVKPLPPVVRPLPPIVRPVPLPLPAPLPPLPPVVRPVPIPIPVLPITTAPDDPTHSLSWD